jgi:hypothetical protein
VQARIAGSGCTSDQALQSVAQSGAATCTGLHAYSGVAGSDLPNAAIAVPPGHWVLFGQVTTADEGGSAMTAYCEIDVNGSRVASASQYFATTHVNGSISVFATATTTAQPATAIGTNCYTDGNSAIWSNGTIRVIPVAALN